MSSECEKCIELILLDDSNYESWCISILHNIKVFNPSLLSIIDASICPLNIDWVDFSKEERKYLKLNTQTICLLTQSLGSNVKALILKEYRFPMDAHLLWKSINENFSEITVAQDSRSADCLIKPVRLVGQSCQTGLAKTAGSRLQRRKHRQSIKDPTSQTSSLYSTRHEKWLMTKDKKKKKSNKVESEEEGDAEYDLDFDKLNKRDMIQMEKMWETAQ
jgi:hypothetical protein